MKYRSIKRKLTITKIARKFQVYFDAVTTEIPSKLIHRVISFEELFIPVSRINEPCIPEERRGEKKKKKEGKKRKRDKIKGTGIVAYTDENRGQCPKSATIPGFVCHHLPPQTCFRVTESIPVGKRGGFAFCVPPNMVRIRINIYERRTGGPRGVARSNF